MLKGGHKPTHPTPIHTVFQQIMAAFRHMLFPHDEVLHCSLINTGSVDDVDCPKAQMPGEMENASFR